MGGSILLEDSLIGVDAAMEMLVDGRGMGFAVVVVVGGGG